MQTLQVKIDAGQTEELAINGDYVRLRLAPYDLVIENPDTAEKVEGSQGDDFELSKFRRLRVTNTGGVDSVFKITYSTGKKAGSAPGVISGTVGLSGQQGEFTQSRASVTNANQAIIAANAGRKYLLIQNNDAAAVLRVNVAGVAATAAQGFRLQPGASMDFSGFNTTAAINVMMETATATAGNVEFTEG